MQVLMDKKASRIIILQKITIHFVLNEISKEFVVISKWGCDVSTDRADTSSGRWKMQVTVIFSPHV